MTADLERHAELVNKKVEELKQKKEALKEEPKKEEPKGASAEGKSDQKKEKQEYPKPEPKPEETKKTEEPKINESKVEKRKEEIQKEIDALVAQQKSLEEKVGEQSDAQKQIERLELALAELTDKIDKKDQEVKAEVDQKNQSETLTQREQERISKYQAEDKDKSFNDRREMSDEELEEFNLENPTVCSRWITKQELRRERERQADLESLKPKEPEKKKGEVNAKTQAGIKKLFSEFPDLEKILNPNNERVKELQKAGKTPDEIVAVFESETPIFKTFNEIAKEHPEYGNDENGPELVLTELKRRSSKKTYTEEEVKQMTEEAAQKERERIASADTGVTSTRAKINVGEKKIPISEAELRVWRKVKPTWADQQIAENLQKLKAYNLKHSRGGLVDGEEVIGNGNNKRR